MSTLDTARMQRVATALDANNAAIRAKGVTVPAGTKLDEQAALIAQIETGGGLVNIIPSDMEWTPGYLSNSGNISAQSSTSLEYTTDYVDISHYIGETITVIMSLLIGTPWSAYCVFGANKDLIGGRTVLNSNGIEHDGRRLAMDTITINASTAKYIRVSMRTYGDGMMVLTPADVFELLTEPAVDATQQ